MDAIHITLKENDKINVNLSDQVYYIKNTQRKEVIPTWEVQVITADTGYDALEQVTVDKVTSEIDDNIKAEYIKKDVSILGVVGNLETANTTEVRITPTSEEQTITPEEPYNGFDKVIVEAQSGINPEEIFNTNVTNANSFLTKQLLKKTPTIDIDPSVKSLDYLLFNWNYNFVPRFNCAKGQITSVSNLNGNCEGVYDLETFFEDIDTSKVVTFSNVLQSPNTQRVGEIECSSCTSISGIAPTYQTWPNITYIGGFKDLGKAYLPARNQNYSSYRLNLALFPNLTPESVIKILDSVYDIASIGVKRQQIYIHANAMSVLKSTEEGQQALANVNAKGWNTPDV